MSEAIFVEGLTKAYHGKTVVDHLNFSVRSGTVFGLLGANGAGKSTTIECMLGTKQADCGTIRLLGQDPKKRRRTLFQRIGVQFQESDYQKEIPLQEIPIVPLDKNALLKFLSKTQQSILLSNWVQGFKKLKFFYAFLLGASQILSWEKGCLFSVLC